MGRVLGIDYGEKRLGLALSDPLRIIASPFDVLSRGEGDLARLEELCRVQEVEEVVLGLPRNADGSEGEMARRVRAFAETLRERLGLLVHLVDESYTSLEADELLRRESRDWRRRKQKVDKVAAQIILRTYLEEGR